MPPVRVGNSGSPGPPPRSVSQAVAGRLRFAWSAGWRGLFCLCRGSGRAAPGPRWTSLMVRPGELRDAQPGLDRQQQQGVVAAAGPAVLVRARPAARRFRRRPGKQTMARSSAFGRDGQDPADLGGVLGVRAAPRSGTGSGSRPAGRCGCGRLLARPVSRCWRNAATSRGVQVGDVQLAGLLPVRCLKRSRAAGGRCPGRRRWCCGLAWLLAGQPVGEERLQDRGERGHGRSPDGRLLQAAGGQREQLGDRRQVPVIPTSE